MGWNSNLADWMETWREQKTQLACLRADLMVPMKNLVPRKAMWKARWKAPRTMMVLAWQQGRVPKMLWVLEMYWGCLRESPMAWRIEWDSKMVHLRDED